MARGDRRRSGGRILVDALRIHGVERVFCVPGESYLAALDALHDTPEIALTVCRHEGAAAMMAEADGKLTGRPGVAFVTRGPGATNASSGVHIAFQDSTPMLLLVGQVGRAMRDREAFQEVDIRRMYGALAKWAAEVDEPARLPEYVSRAFHTATAGRPGPVVLALPEDVLTEAAAVADAGAYRPVQAHPGEADMARLRELLAAAERPLVLLGGGGWSAEAVADMRAFVEANGLPTAVSFRCQDYLDNTHACYAGDVGIAVNPKLAERVRAADLLLVAGARLGEMTTGGYALVDVPTPRQRLVHVHPGAEELGRVYRPTLAINAGMPAFAAAARRLAPVQTPAWTQERRKARADYLAWTEPRAVPGPLQMAEVMAWLRERLPGETIVSNGAGNYAGWVNRFYRYRAYRSQLAPTCGSMGYGLPAAIAAKLRHPERPVVAFAGDGCFQMTGQELATAVQYGAAVVVVVVDNAMYGTIRMHQERHYPGRVAGTDIANPDFAALARAHGAHGETVERTEDFAAAFERAAAAGRPALLHLRLDPEAISPQRSLAEIRATAESQGGDAGGQRR